MKTCTRCGAQMDDNAKFCTACGQAATEAPHSKLKGNLAENFQESEGHGNGTAPGWNANASAQGDSRQTASGFTGSYSQPDYGNTEYGTAGNYSQPDYGTAGGYNRPEYGAGQPYGGYHSDPPYGGMYPAPARFSGAAIASLVLGLVGIVTGLFGAASGLADEMSFGLVDSFQFLSLIFYLPGILAAILGIVVLSREDSRAGRAAVWLWQG